MMRFVVLCGLVIAVAAAPFLNKKATESVHKHTIEKRSQETISFGNHQNSPRQKKSDPALTVKVPNVKVSSQKGLPSLPVKAENIESVTSAASDEIPDTSESIIKVTSKIEPDASKDLKNLVVPAATSVSQIDSNAKSSANEMSNVIVPDNYVAPNGLYDTYYYELLRNAFRRKRRSLSQRMAKRNRRSKRGLGYLDNDYYGDNGYSEDEEELAEMLEPYLQDALNSKYQDSEPLFEDEDPYTGYDGLPPMNDRNTEDRDEDIDRLIETYLNDSPPNIDDSIPQKRSGFLSMMPGNKRKRFQYPYSLEPQGHWGGFVPTYKRSVYNDMRDKLDELASKLARREAYNQYLDQLEDLDLEGYKK